MTKITIKTILCVIAFAATLSAVIICFMYPKVKCELFPNQAIASEPSPDGKVIATILESKRNNKSNYLGSDIQFFLSLEYDNSTAIFTRDLTEGFGSYEGGVHGLRWLSADRILIERYVADRESNIIFDLMSHSWLKQEMRE